MAINVDTNLTKTTPEIVQLENILRNNVMPDLLTQSGFPAGTGILVNCRLNETGQNNPSPIWCGWVEQPPSGFNPIPGDHLSPVYRDAYNQHGNVVVRSYPADRPNEKKPDPRPNPQNPNPFDRDATSGYQWRRYVCIKASNRKAGTLTVGFLNPPPSGPAVETALKDWAKGTNAKTALLNHLTSNFNLGGAPHP